MDSKKLDSFETDDSGFFMFTSKIPEDEKADRVNFMVKDNDGKEKAISIRIGEVPEEIRTDEQFPLSIANLPSVIYREMYFCCQEPAILVVQLLPQLLVLKEM